MGKYGGKGEMQVMRLSITDVVCVRERERAAKNLCSDV